MQPTSNPVDAATGGPVLKTRTFECMGTVIGLTLPVGSPAEGQPGLDELAAATAVVERLFRDLDEKFSLYRPDSEAARLARHMEPTLKIRAMRQLERGLHRRIHHAGHAPRRHPDSSNLVGERQIPRAKYADRFLQMAITNQ